MRTINCARMALAAGGYLATCGNAARYIHPRKPKAGVISLANARKLIELDRLEEFACGALWPYAEWWRPPTAGGSHAEKI